MSNISTRHGGRDVLAFLTCGLIGGVAAIAVASSALPRHVPASFAFDPLLSTAPLVVLPLAAVGGVVVGWFIGAILIARAPGFVHCPRCGTPNARGRTGCEACELSFE